MSRAATQHVFTVHRKGRPSVRIYAYSQRDAYQRLRNGRRIGIVS